MRLTDSQLAAWRLTSGLTQPQAAARLGVHQTTLSNLERGADAPTPARLAQLATLYGAPVARLAEAALKDQHRHARKKLRRPAA